MAKIDGPPPFKFRKESCRLAPYSAWDQERLDTYREGAVLTVHVTQEKSRPLERKYWAILGEVIDKCGTQFRRADDLHKAIKFALGVVDPFVDADGNFQVELRSTSKMQEPEYRRYFDDAIAFIHRMTGVDPLTLHVESADVGEDEPEPSSSDLSPADDAGSAVGDTPPPVDLVDGAAESIASNGEAETGDTEGQRGASLSPVSELSDTQRVRKALLEECAEALLRAAIDRKTADRPSLIEKAADAWRRELPNDHDFVARCVETARRVLGQPANKDQADAYLKSLAMKRARAG